MLGTARSTRLFMRLLLDNGHEKLLQRFVWIGEDDWRIGPHAFAHTYVPHASAHSARPTAAAAERDLCQNVSGRLISISPKVRYNSRSTHS